MAMPANRMPTVAKLRQIIVTRASTVNSYAEAARATLQETATLLQEAGDMTENLYGDVLKVVPPGPDPIPYGALDAAAKLVDSVFTGAGTGPFTCAAIYTAIELVASVSGFPSFTPTLQEDQVDVTPFRLLIRGTLQNARFDLRCLLQDHDDASYFFNLCAPELGILPGTDTWEFWVYYHEQATTQAREAERRMKAAFGESIVAQSAHLRLTQSTRSTEYMSKAEQALQQAISEVDAALVAIRDLRMSVAVLELFMRDLIGEASPAP